MKRLISNTRAQGSMGIARLFLALIAGAIVIWMVGMVSTRIMPGAKEAGTEPSHTQATEWLLQGEALLPAIILLIVILGPIIYAIYERQVVGR